MDSRFLEEKDINGDYPIHNMIVDHSYFFTVNAEFQDRERCCHAIIWFILEVAPQCARQLNKEGRLPLHVAADPQTVQVSKSNPRINLVRDIWKVYPDAVGIVDQLTGLLPLALAVRGPDTNEERDFIMGNDRQIDEGLSSSYFLLRQYPEILSCCEPPPSEEERLGILSSKYAELKEEELFDMCISIEAAIASYGDRCTSGSSSDPPSKRPKT